MGGWDSKNSTVLTRRVRGGANNRFELSERSLGETIFPGDLPMTQMLLFDSPSAASTYSASVPVAEQTTEQVPIVGTQVVGTQVVGTQACQATAAVDHDDADRGGMHRMGDLARLVLLRYELVAQRRAALAAKRKRS
jgi:hypothetical protein